MPCPTLPYRSDKMLRFKKSVLDSRQADTENERAKTGKRYLVVSTVIVLTFTLSLFMAGTFTAGSYMSSGSVEALTVKGESGDGKACWCLHQYYYYTKDQKKSGYWLRKGAMAGDLCAQYNYACFYLDDDNVVKSKSQGREELDLLKKAADQDHENAQRKLGHLYREGRYVARDLKKSEYWFRRAVDNGSIYAMEALARNLLESRNDQESLIEAYMLTAIAIERLTRQDYKVTAQENRERQKIIRQKMEKQGFDVPALVRAAEDRAAVDQAKIPVKPFITMDYGDGFFKNCEELAKK